MNHEFISKVEDMDNALKDLEEVHRQELATRDNAEHRAAFDDEKATLLEDKLPH